MADEKPAQAEKLTPVPVQPVYASQVMLQGGSNDITILFVRNQPVTLEGGGVKTDIALQHVSAIVQMSPQTAKDLSLALADVIKKLEKEFGKLTTTFSKKEEDGSAAQ